jgi:hypothetical protein
MHFRSNRNIGGQKMTKNIVNFPMEVKESLKSSRDAVSLCLQHLEKECLEKGFKFSALMIKATVLSLANETSIHEMGKK